ncbi:transmembrane protein 138 isoform X3 [Trachypithecus francoisi]|uniref:transmembrane protein 138 isoform X3 n=1 Tax=Trachypithecus francoisi TaxID=54180 RepID=UPI00141B136F|nr:transmembrane protein 138 isoform X3 [Trachypithecus francoisi]XP_033059825.1 transmembrane protein 138 isoform X3 [Trachypithecus francoisi]XP_033059826.1 transmembrane protein 138 isoform X3 [Trachypithecus francoisi]
MLQTSNYSLVLSLQFLLLSYDLFVNSFSELLRKAPVIQLVLFMCVHIQDIAVLFNIIIIFLMLFNTFVFQAGLVNLLFHKFKGTIILTAVYFALSISLHVWVMNLRWKNSNSFIWTDGLQTLFVFQRLEAVFAALQGELALCMGKQLDFPRKVQTSCVQHSRRKIFPLANQSVPIGLQCGIPSLPPTSVPPPFLPFLCTIHSP